MMHEADEAIRKGIDHRDLYFVVTHDVYVAVRDYINLAVVFSNVPCWLDFYRAYKAGRTTSMLCGIELRPAQWGEGWALCEKQRMAVSQ